MVTFSDGFAPKKFVLGDDLERNPVALARLPTDYWTWNLSQ
jgi:hypothetical protein